MAKVTGPLMSITASGTFGKEIVYATWKGQQYARKWVTPMNPNSTGQQVIRGYFTASVAAWHAESAPTRAAWTNYVKSQSLEESGFNFYIGQYVKFLIANSGTPPTITNTPPTMG